MGMIPDNMKVVTMHLVLTGDIGVSGNLYGGKTMFWMDEAAAIYAHWVTGKAKVVTRRFSEVLFGKPIHLGELVIFACGNPRKGNTSVTFDVAAYVDGTVKFQAECTFVRVNDQGEKEPVDWSQSPMEELRP